jgi:hypothetical protein
VNGSLRNSFDESRSSVLPRPEKLSPTDKNGQPTSIKFEWNHPAAKQRRTKINLDIDESVGDTRVDLVVLFVFNGDVAFAAIVVAAGVSS